MQEIDIYKIVEGKNPRLARRIPSFVFNYLKRTLHQDEINHILKKYSDLSEIEFVRAALREMRISYHSVGMEKLDPKGRYIFASNHPFGGLDGLMLADEVVSKFGDVRVVVNDLLMHIDPLSGLFVPVNKHGRQESANADAFNDAFESDIPIITFPSGLCSRRMNGVVCDLPWKGNFIRKAVATERDVVPVFFGGVLSNFFYRLYTIRKFLGVKVNIEMLYLPDEMFKQAGSDFEIVIGEPIDHHTFTYDKNPSQWAQYVREKVYEMSPKDKISKTKQRT